MIDSLYSTTKLFNPRKLEARWVKCGPDLKVHPLDPKKPKLGKQSLGIFPALAPFYIMALVAALTIIIIPAHQNTAEKTDDCYDLTSNMSVMETRFHIDIPAAEHLTFSHAKLIDLSWDIGVGQGGRLFHGWLLYHVAARTITWNLEISALPYSVLFNLMFYADSISSLWSLLGLLWGNRRARLGILVKSSLLGFAIAQVLFFATIWSAATGYQSPGVLTYAMPDQNLITKDSDNLKICWKLESRRPELTGVIDGPIVGPRYGTVFSSFTATDRQIADYSEISEEYANLQAYIQSGDTIQAFLRGLPARRQAHPITIVWNETAGFNISTNDQKTMIPASYNTLKSTSESGEAGNGWLPTTIKGWKSLGVGQGRTPSFQDLFFANVSRLTYTPEDGERNEKQKVQFIRSTFELNGSIPYQAGLSMPYNSSLWYKGIEIPLQAPFLGFANCTWSPFENHGFKYYSETGSIPHCLCYKDKEILQDFRVDDHKACTGGAEYVWGFSHFITGIGLVLEVVWSLACVYLYLSTDIGNLNKYGRSATGTLRNALDFAEVVKEELGDDICFYTNKELMKALSDSHPIGYATKERSGGVTHLGLVSVKDGGAVRRKIQLDPNRLYG